MSNYTKSGVSIESGDLFVERIKKIVKNTPQRNVKSGVGGFAALYEQSPGHYLASCADGVGTKIKLGQETQSYFGLGIDLVAMNANDLICVGAEPLFFLDYLAFGKLDLKIAEELIEGIAEGCRQSQMSLIGGETAEMPGCYPDGEFDLAGFAVGKTTDQDLYPTDQFEQGDLIIGIPSSGFHSNGFSLVRKILEESKMKSEALLQEALIPTRIYVSLVKKLRSIHGGEIKGIAHITGGGFLNVARLNSKFDYMITTPPGRNEIAPIFEKILSRADLSLEEEFKVFNRGIGMMMICKKGSEIQRTMRELNEKAFLLGTITKGSGRVFVGESKMEIR